MDFEAEFEDVERCQEQRPLSTMVSEVLVIEQERAAATFNNVACINTAPRAE